MGNICIHASPFHARPIAIVCAVGPAVLKVAEEIGATSTRLDELCKSEAVRNAVCKEMVKMGKENGLRGIELIQHVILDSDEWTPQNGMVTNAQKLNRKAVVGKFEKEIASAYGEKS